MPPISKSAVSFTRWPLLQKMGILLLSGVVYTQTLYFGFVWDDARNIVNNPGLGNTKALFQSLTNPNPQGLTYRPVSELSFALDQKIWGLNPFGFHLTNVLLHVAVTLLVLQLALYLTGSSRIALLSGVIFGVHPIHTEAVAWIAGRTDLLVALFSLISLLLFLRSFSETGAGAYLLMIAAWAGLIIALLTKETAIVLPLLMVICLYHRRPQNKTLAMFNLSIMAGMALLYLGLRSPSLTKHYSYSVGEAIPASIFLIGEYLKLLLFPYPLKPLYELPILSLRDPEVLQALVFLIMGLAVLGYSLLKESILFVGAAWTLVGVMPAFALILYESISPMAERLLYLSSVGFAMACGVVWAKGSDWIKVKLGGARWPIPASLACLLTILSWATLRFSAPWANDEALWKNAAARSPRIARVHYNLATYYLEQKQWKEAIEHYQQALNLKESDADSHYNIGIAYLDQGDPDQAIGHFKEAVQWKPGHSDAYTNLAYAYHLNHRDDLALKAVQQALKINPSSAVAHNSLGNLLVLRGKWQEAAQHYRIALSLKPDYREAQINLENALRQF